MRPRGDGIVRRVHAVRPEVKVKLVVKVKVMMSRQSQAKDGAGESSWSRAGDAESVQASGITLCVGCGAIQLGSWRLMILHSTVHSLP